MIGGWLEPPTDCSTSNLGAPRSGFSDLGDYSADPLTLRALFTRSFVPSIHALVNPSSLPRTRHPAHSKPNLSSANFADYFPQFAILMSDSARRRQARQCDQADSPMGFLTSDLFSLISAP